MIRILLGLALCNLAFDGCQSRSVDLPASAQPIRRKCILDVDPGGDDAMAMFIMLSDKNPYEVAAITIVNGNTDVNNATINALRVLKTANKLNIPVYMGSKHGLMKFTGSDYFFGNDGLGDFKTEGAPPITMAQTKHAAEAIRDMARNEPGVIDLLCLGPLTNLALALHLNPNLYSDLRRVVILGGSHQGGGNVQPSAEFNIYADPEGAYLAFSKAIPEKPLILVPIEAAKIASTTLDWRLNVLGRIPSPAIQFLNLAERKTFTKDTWGVYDPLAAAILMDPSIVTGSIKVNVDVETGGMFSRGATIMNSRSPNSSVIVVTDVDKTKVKTHLLQYLS